MHRSVKFLIWAPRADNHSYIANSEYENGWERGIRVQCLTVRPCASVELRRCVATNLRRSDLTLTHDSHRYTDLGVDTPQEIVIRL